MTICSRTPNSPVVLTIWVLHACRTRPKVPPAGKCFKIVSSEEIVYKTTPNGKICCIPHFLIFIHFILHFFSPYKIHHICFQDILDEHKTRIVTNSNFLLYNIKVNTKKFIIHVSYSTSIERHILLKINKVL